MVLCKPFAPATVATVALALPALLALLLAVPAAGQTDARPRECASMGELNRFADAVTAVCCDVEADECDGNGVPARCDVDCAPAILEMQAVCGPFLLAQARFLGALKDDLDALEALCPANIVPDPTVCATMEQFTDYADTVTSACCDGGGSNACVDGNPTQCDDQCGAVLLPMQADCSAYLEANSRFLAAVDGQIDEAAALCTWRPSAAAPAAGDASCTATAGGLGPAVPWDRPDGSELSVCLDAGNAAAAVGTPSQGSGSPTITIANAGYLRVECGRHPAGGASSAEAELCGMADRLEAAAAATLSLVGLLFQDLTAGGDGQGGAIELKNYGNGGAIAVVVRCTFRRNSARNVRSPPPPPPRRPLTLRCAHPGPVQSGGAICASDGTTLTVQGSVFADNTATVRALRPHPKCPSSLTILPRRVASILSVTAPGPGWRSRSTGGGRSIPAARS
jgi:hypothetical protein